MRKVEKRVEFWKELLESLDGSWKKKKGRPYPFIAKDFRMMKQMLRFYTVPEVMALWQCYLESSPFFGSKTGYLISGFWEERSILLESPKFKKLAQHYEHQLSMIPPDKIIKDLEFDFRRM